MILRFVSRFRYVIVGAVAVADGILDGISTIFSTSDFATFNKAGTAILTGHWGSIFSDPWVQVGPLTLVFSGLFSGIHALLGVKRALAFSVFVYLALAFGAIALVRFLMRDHDETPSPLLEVAIGIATITSGMAFYTLVSGHPSETIIAALWVLAARDAGRERGFRAGLWIALGGAFKLWGILGIPLALLARSWKSRLQTVAVAGVGLLVLYAPFMFVGKVGMFSLKWNVSTWSPLSLFMEPGTEFTWTMRLVQGVAVVVLGVIPVLVFRGRRDAVWAAPLGVVLARLATDPLLYNYYWLAAEILALVGIALLVPRVRWWGQVGMLLGFYAVSFFVFLQPLAATMARYALLIALLVVARRVDRAPAAPDRAATLASVRDHLVISGSTSRLEKGEG